MAKKLGIPVECQRFQLWAKQQNHNYRPHMPLTKQEEAQTVWYLLNRDFSVTHHFLNPSSIIGMNIILNKKILMFLLGY